MKSTNTFSSFVNKLTAGIAGIKQYVSSSTKIVLNGQTMTPAQVTSLFQTFITTSSNADAALAAAKTQVAARKAATPGTKQQYAAFVKWVEVNFGTDSATLAQFGIAPKKPRSTTSSTSKALSAAKRKATLAQKAAAKASTVKSPGTMVAYDGDGNPIGGAAAAAPATGGSSNSTAGTAPSAPAGSVKS